MTLDEAKKVAAIVETSQGGCSGCLDDALRQLNEAFPDYRFTLVKPEGFMAAIEVEEAHVEGEPAEGGGRWMRSALTHALVKRC